MLFASSDHMAFESLR